MKHQLYTNGKTIEDLGELDQYYEIKRIISANNGTKILFADNQ
ncbi:hypothetical protein [Winogradskyella sp. R77965]